MNQSSSASVRQLMQVLTEIACTMRHFAVTMQEVLPGANTSSGSDFLKLQDSSGSSDIVYNFMTYVELHGRSGNWVCVTAELDLGANGWKLERSIDRDGEYGGISLSDFSDFKADTIEEIAAVAPHLMRELLASVQQPAFLKDVLQYLGL